LKIYPKNSGLYYKIGIIYYKLGKLQKARQLLSLAIGLDKNSPYFSMAKRIVEM